MDRQTEIVNIKILNKHKWEIKGYKQNFLTNIRRDGESHYR